MILWSSIGPAIAEPGEAADSEVRVLIDVSGSMKRTDPDNLRAPALRLLVGLMPPSSRGGIWLFGEDTREIVPPSPVTDGWQSRAREAANQIHSRSQFTDIGGALETAIDDWQTPPGEDGITRNLILLTDGMVDISKEEGVNPAERQRILDEVVPRLQEARVNVHAVALSPEADAELLEALSTRTDGAFAQVDEAAELERIFLHMFESSTTRDALPMDDPRLKVDESISELTLLLFREDKDAPVKLVPPDGVRFGRAEAQSMGNVKWHREGIHDLITIEDPTPGEWLIEAEMDPDNRAMVVTDLKLEHSRLPNRIFDGEALELATYLTEGGERITREAFLNLVSMVLRERPPGGVEPTETFLHDFGLLGDRQAGDGYFDVRIDERLIPGQLVLEFVAKSPTFQRTRRHAVEIREGALLSVRSEVLEPGTPGARHQVVITPDTRVLDPEGAQLKATVTVGDAAPRLVPMERVDGEVPRWRLRTDPAYSHQQQRVTVHFAGQTRMGRPIDYQGGEILLPPTAPARPDPASEAPAINWLWVGLGFLGVNLLAGGLVWFTRRFLRKQRARQLEGMLEAFDS